MKISKHKKISLMKGLPTSIRVWIILGVLVLAGFALRMYLLPSHLFFGPEQGRDLLVVRDMVVSHKLTLIGSKTDIAGIFHGPVYYYLTAIPFYLSHGDPLVIAGFYIAIHSISVVVIYLLAKELFDDNDAPIVAAALYSVAFGCIVFSRWLSNPPLTIPLSALFFLFLMRFLKGNQVNLIFAAAVFALLGQVEFINFLIFGLILVCVFLRHVKSFLHMHLTTVLGSITVGIAGSFGTYLLFDIRHDFLISKSLGGLFSGNTGVRVPFPEAFFGVVKVLGNLSAMELGFIDWRLGLVLFLMASAVFLKARSSIRYADMILLWIYAPVVVFITMRHVMLTHFFAGLLPGIILILAYCVTRLLRVWKPFGMTAVCLILFLNVRLVYTDLPQGKNVFFQNVTTLVRYADELRVISGIYDRAKGREFSFQAYTIPYFWQDAWTYLFWYVGSKNHVFIPYKENSNPLFVIIQKDRINPGFQKGWYEKTVSTWGSKTDFFRYGEFSVEAIDTAHI